MTGDLYPLVDKVEGPLPPRLVATGVAIVALLLVGVVGLVTVRNSASLRHADLATAVDNAFSSKTASIQMTETAGPIHFAGSGAIDFDNAEMRIDGVGHVAGQSINLTVETVKGVIYEHLPQMSQYLSGKSWLELDLSSLIQASGNTGAFGSAGNPVALLKAIAAQGATVTPIGASKVDGFEVEGYKVTIDPAKIENELANAQLPAWMRQALASVSLSSETQYVYVDGSNRLRRMTMDTTGTGNGHTISISVSVDFVHYGVPVSITVPPASQVFTFEQLLQLQKTA